MEKEDGVMVIGSNCFIMVCGYVVYDCKFGDYIIIVNGIMFGGYVYVYDYVIIFGVVVVYYFIFIGSYSFVGGFS